MVPNSHSLTTEKLLDSSNPWEVSELQDRLNSPVGVLLLGFLALPLSRISPRGGVYGNMLVAFGIYFVYSNLQKINHSWVAAGKIPLLLGYFWVDALLLLLAGGLLMRTYGIKWLLTEWHKG